MAVLTSGLVIKDEAALGSSIAIRPKSEPVGLLIKSNLLMRVRALSVLYAREMDSIFPSLLTSYLDLISI